MTTGMPERQQANFPTADQHFVIVKIAASYTPPAAAAKADLMPAVRAAVAVVANALSSPTWPQQPKSMVISNDDSAASLYISSTNGTHAAGEGLVVPAGQSFFLGYREDARSSLQYTAAADFSVAVYF